MLRKVVVASGFGLSALACGAGGADDASTDQPTVSSSRGAFTKLPTSTYASYEPTCGCLASSNFSTQWLLRGGGEGATCSPKVTYMCLDDARFSNVWARGDGSSYALGSFNGKLEIGGDVHQSGTSLHDYPVGWSVNNAFLTKVSQAGQTEWTRAFVGSDNTWTYGLTEDGIGNVYIAGTFADPLTIGPVTLYSSGSVDVFVAKLDPSGNPIWAVSGGSPDYDYPSDLLVTSGRVYIVGTTGAGSKYGPVTLTSHGGADAFIAGLDQGSGAWVSGESAGGAGADSGRAIATASNGALLIGGSFAGPSTLFGQSVVSSGESDGFVAKVSQAGSLAWLRVLGGAGEASIDAVASNASTGIAVAGWGTGIMTFGSTTASSVGEDDGFVAGISQSGSVHWSKTMGGVGSDRARGVAVDSDGGVFVTGAFSKSALFGLETLQSAGGADVFVAEIREGEWSELVQAGGPGDDAPRRIANLGKNKLWVTGRVLAGPTNFAGAPFGVDGIADAFLWHLRRSDCDGTY